MNTISDKIVRHHWSVYPHRNDWWGRPLYLCENLAETRPLPIAKRWFSIYFCS